ncbi:MAG TPA: hypothetical protein PLH15_09040 [Spirochaetota bacterium]|jgi:hypothetical protein|nr:hypothetical protein [Spirochaetota bacterium]HQO22704.1 hypothetical protein [Spirochaetota bacterium]HQQ23970.1 hypothetical protein [Spirochaetota bacterium]
MKRFMYSGAVLLIIASIGCKQNSDSISNEKWKETSETKTVEQIQNTEEEWKKLSKFLTDNSPFREAGDGIFIYFEKDGILYSKGFSNSEKEKHKSSWEIDQPGKCLFLHILNYDGKDLIKDKYYSFSIGNYKGKISGIILSKDKYFEEQDDAGNYLVSDKYLTLTVAKYLGSE